MSLKDYIKSATSKIFGIKEKESVSLELTDHILCKQEYYEDIGYEQGISEEKAVEEMGDSLEIADYLGSIHNDFYNPIFDIIGFAVWAMLLVGSYLLMHRFILDDVTAVPVSIGCLLTLVGMHFGFNAINIKRNRRVPMVLTFIIGLGISVLAFIVNISVELFGISSISKLTELMIKGNLPEISMVNFVPPVIISAVIVAITVVVFAAGMVFAGKYERLENTLKTNRSKRAFEKVLVAICVFLVAAGGLFVCDVFVIQSKYEKKYISDYELVFDIAQSCENREQVENYIEEKGYSFSCPDGNIIVIDGSLSDITLDFTPPKEQDSDDPWVELMSKIVFAYIKSEYSQSLERQNDYVITYDAAGRLAIDGYGKGADSLGLAKIRTNPSDLDNIFDFAAKDEGTSAEMIELYGKYYPKVITLEPSNNHKTHITRVNFEYLAGSGSNAFTQAFETQLESENGEIVKQQQAKVMEVLNSNPDISNEELAKAVGAKYTEPDISFDDYKEMFNYIMTYYGFTNSVDDVDDEEIREAYQDLYTFDFSDDLHFYRMKYTSDSGNEVRMIIFNSKTNVRYISVAYYGDAAEKYNNAYESQYMGTFRKTRCGSAYYDIHGKAYNYYMDVAYYAKNGERFRYFEETDDEGKLVEKYFIGSKGSKCLANDGFVDTDGYFVCGNGEIYQNIEVNKSEIKNYHDADGNQYKKACEVSWDSNGELVDFDEYLNK